MAGQPDMTRRRFLRVSFTAGGGLVVGAYLAGCTKTGQTAKPSPGPTTTAKPAIGPTTTARPATSTAFEPNLFVRIDPDSSVTLTINRSETGQGVGTALAMILAEELDVDWGAVGVETSPANRAIGSQLTSGSGSIADNYDTLRQAGASARHLLVAAAAQAWGVPTSDLTTAHGMVIRTATGERRRYGDLVAMARGLNASGSPALKDAKDFKLIGTSVRRVEEPAIVRGKATYGIDVRLPNLRFAVVARCPVAGGKVAGFDPAPAKAVAGVVNVIQISNGVAVVANTTWAAIKGRAALQVTWNEGDLAALSSGGIESQMQSAIQGAIAARGPRPSPGLDALYQTPYLAHAAMEPLNCVADVRSDRCEVWASTQNPQDVQTYVKAVAGRPTTVHVTHVGGGFGRRLEVDFAVEAAEVSKAIGAPVQVVWTRDDDIRHDYYRPPTLHWMRAGWDASGNPNLWRHLVAAPGLNGVIYRSGREVLQDGLDVPYGISDSTSNATLVDIPLPTGPWRAVFDGPNAFANECFLDEVAAAVRRDPLDLRLSLLSPSDPVRTVLQLAASKGGWGSPLPHGHGRGLAVHQRTNTPVAMVAEVSAGGGRARVHRVVCAVDCGTVINPDVVVAQIEGGVVFALTAMLHGAITFDQGRVSESNFHDYKLLQMADMPAVEVHLVPSTQPPQGVGEMGVPPLAPAVANGLFAATGKRIRRLPVLASDLS